MKVIKVIVDELPESCNECPYPYGVQNEIGWFCGIMQTTAVENEMGETEDYPANNYLGRPDWCPLVTLNESVDWFANAIMAGYDHARAEMESEEE